MAAAAFAAMYHDGRVSENTLVRTADGGPLRFVPLQRVRALREAIAGPVHHVADDAPEEAAVSDSGKPSVLNAFYYTDDGGCERGPLSLAQMRALVEQGFVTAPRPVRCGAGKPRDLTLWPELLDVGDTARGEPSVQAGDGADGSAGGSGGCDGSGDEGSTAGGFGAWEAMDEDEWVYIDDDGGVQGPFATAEMRTWLRHGMLERTRLVNLAGGDENGFQRADEWAELAMRQDDDAVAEVTAVHAHDDGSGESDTPPHAPAPAEASAASAAVDCAPPSATSAAAHEVLPASGGGASSATADTHWLYADDTGTEQGPFSTAKLVGWCRRGLLQTERLVRPVHRSEWRPMAEWPPLANALAASMEMASGGGAGERTAHTTATTKIATTTTTAVPATAPTVAATGTGSGADGGAGTGTGVGGGGGGDDAPLDERSLWEYVDDEGRTQGPFTARKLLSWLRSGHLKATRRVRRYIAAYGGGAGGGGAEGGSGSGGGGGVGSGSSGGGGGDYVPIASVECFARALFMGRVLPPPPPATPSLSAGHASHVETPLWLYVDSSGVEQGPFAATQIGMWAAHGYLPSSTLVRHLSEPPSQHRTLGGVPQLGGHAYAPADGTAASGAAGGPDCCEAAVGTTSSEEVRRWLSGMHADNAVCAAMNGGGTYAAESGGTNAAESGGTQAAGAGGARAAALAPTATTAYKDYTVVRARSRTRELTDPRPPPLRSAPPPARRTPHLPRQYPTS